MAGEVTGASETGDVQDYPPMLQINLSALNTRELRQLLDASRRRGDAALSYKVLQEMQVRREGSGKEGAPHVVELEPAEAEDDDLPPAPLWPPGRTGQAQAPELELEPELGQELEPEPEADPEPALTLAAAREPQPRRRAAKRKDRLNGHAEPLRFDEPLDATTAAARDADRPLNLDGFDPEPAAMAGPDDDGLRLGGGAPRPPPARPKKPRKPAPRAPLGFAIGLALGAALGWGVAVYNEGPPPAAQPLQTAAVTPPPAAP
ncbi:MAG: hypothetical protein JSR98_02715, partial [Proteobacteria bacterium]|nr:hypothetical protein [Pseudomonadota bacterium]